MRDLTVFLFAALCLVSGTLGKKGFGPGEQEWGYVNVRPHASMFWWLYYTTADVASVYEKPLVIWLQGGPGASSTSYGNFEELGPIDTNLKPRNYTWVKDYNVLFIDNPVGTGYSYTSLLTGYATTNAVIASDLVECMKGILKELPQFANVPTYITTESYGGKMGAEFALVWYQAQKAGTIKSNLKGVAMGDAWISPIDSVMTWAPFLLATGMVDTAGYKAIDQAAQRTKKAVEAGQWGQATSLWGYTERVIMQQTGGIDFYNILTKTSSWRYNYDAGRIPAKPQAGGTDAEEYSLDSLMNGQVRQALGITKTHGAQSSAVFSRLEGDFMRPVTNIVERLLNETDINVVVLSGHLDLIVDTPGTLLWVERLKWKHAHEWLQAGRYPLAANGIIEGYVKSYRNFAMYWVNRAGHMVPKDNPAAMAKILDELTGNA